MLHYDLALEIKARAEAVIFVGIPGIGLDEFPPAPLAFGPVRLGDAVPIEQRHRVVAGIVEAADLFE